MTYEIAGAIIDLLISLIFWAGVVWCVVALRRRIKHGPRRPLTQNTLTPDQYAYQNAYAWREHNETNMR